MRAGMDTTWEPELMLTGHKEETHTHHELGGGEACDNMVVELDLDPC